MKTLLLNSSYEPLSFISFKNLIRLIVKDKVEVLSKWDDEYISWISGKIEYPSIVRLKYYIKRTHMTLKFNRSSIFRRDFNTCQYCGFQFSTNELSIDHVVPRCQGGSNSWKNCVTACFHCNNRKGDRTPEEADMQLLRPVTEPRNYLAIEYILTRPKHNEWETYFSNIVEYVEPKNH